MDARPTAARPGRAGRLRRGAARALTVGALVPAVALAIGTPALADVTAVSGSASGVIIDVEGTVDINLGPLPTVNLPADGAAQTDTLANVNAPGLLTTGVAEVNTAGTLGPGGSVTSSAEVANVDLGTPDVILVPGLDLATASLISSTCTANEAGAVGSSTITGLTALGQPVTVTGAPNQEVDIAGLGTLFINEQVINSPAPSSGITVNALRIELDVPVVGTGSVIIAQSVCAVTGDDVVVPTGAIGGVLLTGLVAVAFTGFQLSRRRRARGSQA